MGLDQRVYVTYSENALDKTGFDVDAVPDTYLVWEWRKHADLQEWMEQLYLKKCGSTEPDCFSILLTEDDITRLREDTESVRLPKTSSPTWGSTIHQYLDTIKFCDKALEYVKVGTQLFYYASW